MSERPVFRMMPFPWRLVSAPDRFEPVTFGFRSFAVGVVKEIR